MTGSVIRLAGLGLLALLGACSSPNGPATVRPQPTALSNSPTTPLAISCSLQVTRDVLLRVAGPQEPAETQRLGDVDFVHCRHTVDDVSTLAPQAPGYCSTVAYASDNPGYDENQVPSRPLQAVIASSGPGC